MNVEELEQEVLQLPAELRARLAERLLASLDGVAEFKPSRSPKRKRPGHGLDEPTGAIPVADALASAREQARLASFYVRPEALDEFIESWRTSREEDEAVLQIRRSWLAKAWRWLTSDSWRKDRRD